MTFFALLAAFGGGIFGALIGGTAAFIFTGILGLTGIAVSLAGGGDIILDEVAFGPFFGPHISFVGAVAAAAYAGKLSMNRLKCSIKHSSDEEVAATITEDISLNSSASDMLTFEELNELKDDDFIDGTDTTVPLFITNDPIVLLVGGIFGALGYLTHILYESIWVLPLDTVALTVTTFAIICRLLFGTSGLFGVFPSTEKRFNFTGKTLTFNMIWGFGLAVVVSYICILLDINNIGFVISAISLIFLYFGLQFPVSHHVTMVAGVAALAFGNVFIGGVFGVLAVITGEYVSRMANSYVDTHVDMPAIVISTWSFVILGILL
jgi:hypothetical protein